MRLKQVWARGKMAVSRGTDVSVKARRAPSRPWRYLKPWAGTWEEPVHHHVGTDVGFGVGNGVGWGVGRGVGAGSGATVGDPSLTDGDRVGDFVGDCEGFVVGAGSAPRSWG